MKYKIIILLISVLLSSCFNKNSKKQVLSAEELQIKQASSRLYNKIKYGSVRDLEYYIERGAVIDQQIPSGMSQNPLIHALETQNLRNAWYLLSLDCDITYIDKWGNNALMWAMYRGVRYEDLAIELISRGSDVTITNKVGNSAFDKRGNNLIEYAGRCRSSIKILNLLFEHGANVTDRSLEYFIGEELGSDRMIDSGKIVLDKTIESGYETNLDPMIEAAMLNNTDYFKNFIKNNIDKSDIESIKKLRSTLIYMSALGYTDLLRIVINYLDNPADNYEYEVTIACWYGKLESLDTLIQLGADFKQLDKKTTPLMTAVKRNNKKLVKLLLDNGAELTGEEIIDSFTGEVTKVSPEEKFLNLVVEFSDLEMFKLLEKYGFDLNKTSKLVPQEIRFSQDRTFEILQYLIKNNFNLNLSDDSHFEVLYYFCFSSTIDKYEKDFNVFKLLVDNGANLNSEDYNPINLVLEFGDGLSVKKLKYLLEHGAKINKKTIIYAIESGYLENVKMVIEAGADIYKYSFFGSNSLDGRNALQLACRAGYLDIVEYFISLGFNPSYPAEDGNNSLRFTGSREVEEYLIDLGVKRDINSENMMLPGY